MLDRSVSYFLSNQWSNTPLYAEKIIPLLDTCLSNNFVLSDKVADAFYELTNKYQNTADLPLENLKEFIREQGYGYILDLVIQDEQHIKLLWYLLVLIHQLKGTKEGLMLVLSLLTETFDPAQTRLIQWYESMPVGTPNTFKLETNINVAQLGGDFFSKFQTFLSNYIYPEMLTLNLNYNIDGRIVYRPYARLKVYSDAVISLNDFVNGGSARDEFVDSDHEFRSALYNGGSADTWMNKETKPNDFLTNIKLEKVFDSENKVLNINITGTVKTYRDIDGCTYIKGGNAVLEKISIK